MVPGWPNIAMNISHNAMGAVSANQKVHRCNNPKGRVDPQNPLGIPPGERFPDIVHAEAGKQKEQTVAQMSAHRQCWDRPDVLIMAIRYEDCGKSFQPVDKLKHICTAFFQNKA